MLLLLLLFVITVSGALGVTLVVNRLVWEPRRRVAENSRPTVTAADFRDYWQRLEDAALPVVRLEPIEGIPAPLATRIGGAPWAPNIVADWPTDREGRVMEHLAQINFAEMKGLDGFPASGLLQIFVRLTDGVPETEGTGSIAVR